MGRIIVDAGKRGEGQYGSCVHIVVPSNAGTVPSGSLAQLVEQRTLNPLVRGSSPRRPTIFRES
jgi:hypothetical protein